MGRRRRDLVPLQWGAVLVALVLVTFISFLVSSSPEAIAARETEAVEGRRLQFGIGSKEPENFPLCNFNSHSEFTQVMSHETMLRGGVVVHIFVLLVMFAGIAVVCDEYFEPALSMICEYYKLKEDVAGATFMAFGGSSPELATSLIGVFVTQSDIGIGTAIGSASCVYMVTGFCSFVAPGLILTAWPLMRDSVFYCIVIGVVVIFFADQQITWYESLILILLYGVYVIIALFNERLENAISPRVQALWWMLKGGQKSAKVAPSYDIAPTTFPTPLKGLSEGVTDARRSRTGPVEKIEKIDETENVETVGQTEKPEKFSTEPTHEPPGKHGLGELPPSSNRALVASVNAVDNGGVPIAVQDAAHQPSARRPSTYRLSRSMSFVTLDPIPVAGAPAVAEDDDDRTPLNPFEVPESVLGKISWAIQLPMVLALWATVPDCRREDRKRYFMATFLMCILWIAILTYVMVWMATEIGIIANIPQPVMGLTVLAWGTSLPDIFASMAVARRGFGDMAISSTIGSNIFDMAFGLAVSWFLYTAVVNPGSVVEIKSKGLGVIIIVLFLMVWSVVISVHLAGWKLNKPLGVVMFVLYCVFLAFSLCVEYQAIPSLQTCTLPF